MLDIKFYEVFKEEHEVLKEKIPKKYSYECTDKTIQESGDDNTVSKLISIRTQSKIPNEWSEELEGIFSRSMGHDHLLKYLNDTKTNVACGYLPNYCARNVAEHAITLMFAVVKNVHRQMRQMNEFNRDGLIVSEVFKKNALVVGVGCIGSEIVDMLKGLKLKVKGVDVVHSVENLDYVPLSEGLGWADIVFCAASLTESSNRLLGYERLKSVNNDFVLVNVSRGEITPIDDVIKLMEEGLLLGVGLDVYEQEQLLGDSLRENKKSDIAEKLKRLKKFEKVVCTPHNAFNSREAIDKKVSFTIKAIDQFFKDNTFPQQVKK